MRDQDDKKLLYCYVLLALVPVLLLAGLFPERLVREPRKIAELYSVPGAAVVVFYQQDCPHCRALKSYALQQGWPVEYFEMTSPQGQDLFRRLQKKVAGLAWVVPTVVVNGMVMQGYESDQSSGAWIDGALASCRTSKDGCLAFARLLAAEVDNRIDSAGMSGASSAGTSQTAEAASADYRLRIWLFGEVNLVDFSLPVLALLLGFLDGFNPCAMWVLVSLLTLLFALNDMRKMVVVGATFLLVSGLMYYLFIAAWLNVFLLLGYNFWVQKGIGMVAVVAGGFYLYEAFGRDPNVCRVTDQRQRQRILARMHRILQASAWPLMLLGVALLAISVNMIELVCTAGLPAVFTQILANNNVSTLARYGYLLLYIIMYMLDDLLIFLVALVTMEATGLTTRYRRLTLMVGGFLMYGLGLLLIFFPEALMFSG